MIMAWGKKYVLREGEDGNGSSGAGSGGLDIAAAVADISSSLGFGKEPEDGDTGADGGGTPAPAPTPTPAPAPSPTPAPGDGSAPAPAPTPAPVEAPRTWRPDAQAKWTALPPEVQQEVLKREEDMFKGLNVYKEDAQRGKAFNSVFEPHMPLLQQTGLDPVGLTKELFNAHILLATGTPQAKADFMQHLMKSYGVELAQTDPSLAPYVDPTVSALQKQLEAVQSKLADRDRQELSVKQQQLQKEADTFKGELKAFSEDPKNEFFFEVATDIAAFVGQGVPLKDAYQKACWQNEAVRQKLVDRETAKKLEETRKSEAEAAAKAKKAAAVNVNVRTKQTSGGTTGLGSIDDTMKETLAALRASES
jgi:hypothetical protein